MSPFSAADRARHRDSGHWGEVTIHAMFAATAARVPDRPGLIDPPNRTALVGGAPRRLTYARMQEEVDQLAEALRAQGLGAGSLVAVQYPNVAELVLLYLALARIGAILSPISLAHRSAELAASARIADFDAYVAPGMVSGRPFYAERLAALPSAVRRLGLGPDLPDGVVRLDDGVQRAVAPAHQGSADDLYAVFWTSGTEGAPKAVPKTHNNMMASSLGAWRILDLPDGGNILAPFPFVNAAAMGGLMMCWMRTAGAMILHHPFHLDTFLKQLAQEDVTYTMVAPALLVDLRDRADDPALRPALLRLRAIGTGSAPPDPEVFGFFRDRFDVQVLNFFGSNEGAQMCASGDRVVDPRKRARFFPRDGDVNWPEGTGRRTANGGRFRLRDSDGAPVTRPGEIGEMWIEGPALMPGYYRRDASGVQFDRGKFDAQGYFATADLFEISDCGTLIRFHARARELIVRGGVKISPVELDNAIAAMPAIREAAVAPYADPRLGEKVCVFVVPEGRGAVTLSEVIAHCDAQGLARYKWPERLITLEALPRTPLAKLDRKALIRRLAEETTAAAG
ncbi:class I adenylate-forming enzyme family protein [Pseudooceanicola aestuarii]|uniref:class I adenylate-forming enzyme family protein n=1 Tax=Pseudooceanicola aestuarii TaxID=2697319 RepID=UPI0013D380FE|nr:class I adenylate-forming enzyme family protein [Pseudooceanicola aestuarii]